MHFQLLVLLMSLALATPLPPSTQKQIPMSSSTSTTVYFGYGSNLWLHQMSIRCPSSQYLGIARLNNYKWLINDRGYANVVQINGTNNTSTPATDADAYTSTSTTSTSTTESGKSKYANVVFGLVYSLTSEDEKKLDKNEGVPIAYTKETLSVDFWSAGEASGPLVPHGKIDIEKEKSEEREMLVYIDRQRMKPDEPRKEYIYRMNQGIADAVKVGVPKDYVEEVMREYIPEEEGEEEMEEFAKGQAARFRDESGVFR